MIRMMNYCKVVLLNVRLPTSLVMSTRPPHMSVRKMRLYLEAVEMKIVCKLIIDQLVRFLGGTSPPRFKFFICHMCSHFSGFFLTALRFQW
jgi:hypothetical protein